MTGWRVHAGDDLAFAAPNFDDTSWQQVTFSDSFILSGPAAAGSARWMRRRILLPDTNGPLDVFFIGDAGSFEVYLDGKRVGPGFTLPPLWSHQQEIIVPLRTANDPDRREVVIAVRSHLTYSSNFRRLTFRGVMVGSSQAVAIAAEAHHGVRVLGGIFAIAVGLAAVCVGIFLLFLLTRQRDHPEYLWLALAIIFAASYQAFAEATIYGLCPVSLNAMLGDPSLYFFLVSELAFVYSFIDRKPPAALRAFQALLLATPFILNPLSWIGRTPVSLQLAVEAALVIPCAVLVLVLLAGWYRQGSHEAGLLFIPILLLNGSFVSRRIEFLLRFAIPGYSFPNFTISGIILQNEPLALILFLAFIGIVMLLRFLNINQQQTRAQSELASARTIQQFLVPQAFPQISGLQIDSVYKPAQQVGGDFFQIIALPEGGALAVIGDVSGKGLPAAMNVALIVGLLSVLSETAQSPAELLARLNRRLRGRGTGFTTCLILRFHPGGALQIANAGHLNPYLCGRELPTESSLPLGLDLDVDCNYTETSLTLTTGDSLTLLTDGIVEARDPRSGEIFGFERTAAISGQSALEIATRAQAFGQDDDIAVLTIRYAQS